MLAAGAAAPPRCAAAVWLILVVMRGGTEGVAGGVPESVIRVTEDKTSVPEQEPFNYKFPSNMFRSPDQINKAAAEEIPVTYFLSDDDVTDDKRLPANDSAELNDGAGLRDQELNKTLSHMYDLIGTDGEVKYPLEEDLVELRQLKSILDFLEEESGADIDPEFYTDTVGMLGHSEKEGKEDDQEKQPNSDVKELNDVAKSRSKRRAPNYLSSTERLNDAKKLRRRSSRRGRRDVRMTSPYADEYNEYSEGQGDSGMIDYSNANTAGELTERKMKLAEEVKAEEQLLDALFMQKRIEKAREAAIDDLIYGIETGKIPISVPTSDSRSYQSDSYRIKKSKQSKSYKPVYIPIVHKGVKGFFIPDFTTSKRGSEESPTPSYVDEEEEWQAVVPESYRASLLM